MARTNCYEIGSAHVALDFDRKPTGADIRVEHHGSVVIIRGVTDAGHAWVEEHISDEGYQPIGLGARLAEPRYVADVVEGAIADGLTVSA